MKVQKQSGKRQLGKISMFWGYKSNKIGDLGEVAIGNWQKRHVEEIARIKSGGKRQLKCDAILIGSAFKVSC